MSSKYPRFKLKDLRTLDENKLHGRLKKLVDPSGLDICRTHLDNAMVWLKRVVYIVLPRLGLMEFM
jgi:hypothetical protein